MGVNIFITCVAVLLLILLIIYRARFWGHPKEVYSPKVSWTRAWIVFCIFFIISWAFGTMDNILSNPIVSSEQLEDPKWIAWTAGCFVLIFVAYWIIWARWTVIFDRKRYPVSQVIFGLVWGASIAQIFLVFWHFAGIFGFPVWGRWILAYLMMSSHGLWMDLYWDVYVLPEHDTPWSLKWKVICSHIPNMLACLTYLAIYNNLCIFIMLQALALTGAAVTMRVPPFWEKDYINPPRTAPGLFGLPHAVGYIEKQEHEA
jgi:hypothetical protein